MISTVAGYLHSLGVIETGAITEDILRKLGFKWHQFDRQPDKHWVLWLGNACGQRGSYEDLGIELAWWAPGSNWFCWLRSDTAHRYSRFVHIRHLTRLDELVLLIEGLTGAPFDPRNCMYGGLQSAADAARMRAEKERADLRCLFEGHPWREVEKDDSRGRPLVDHMEAAVKAGVAK